MASLLVLFNIVKLIIVVIIIFPVSITAQRSPYRNVTLRSSIVASNADDATTWTSPSGEFACGFRQVSPGAFLLAIWFDQIPQKTLVWSANRDNPVQAGSLVQLSAQGTLELTDPTSRRIWSKPAPSSAYAAMLDTGNFVLADNTSTILWQSFEEPTDTLLPSQVLNQGGVLVSSFSETNYSRGKFKLAMQADGDLVLWTRSFPLDDNIDAYWSSRTYQTDSRLIFNTSGHVYLMQSNGTLLDPNFFFESGVPTGQLHQRLTLEYDGVIRHYVYPNSSSPSSWSVFDYEPENICLHIGEEYTGGGACGFNSICTNGVDGRPTCSCPPGYSSRGGLNGCGPDFTVHRCDQLQSQDAQHFTFEVLANTDWPGEDHAVFRGVEEEWCRQSCHADCYCAVAVYSERNCFKKSLPFTNGRVNSGFNAKTMVKVRKDNNTAVFNPTNTLNLGSKSNSTALVITLSVLLGCSVLLLLLFIFCFNHRKPIMIVGAGSRTARPAGVNTISGFNFDELEEATKGFSDELGMGAFSTVYKGVLKGTEKVVAVKKLQKMAKEADLEFIAEVSSISRTNHKNLVQLLGYCDEGQNRILVYEFMTNGSLATFLFDKSPKPAWHMRVHIAFAIARGLCYLHEECSVPIIHCDIKPQNVLLDESYTPKIADFGLAKLMKPDQTRTTTGIRGTRGYVAPEWFRNMPITVKVDVYSFGILLLEILCCRRNYIPDLEDEREAVLADWAYDCYQQEALDLLVEGDEEARSDMKMFEIFVETAIWCIQEDPTLRPHMKMVMHMLEGLIQVPAPPDPTTFIA